MTDQTLDDNAEPIPDADLPAGDPSKLDVPEATDDVKVPASGQTPDPAAIEDEEKP